MGFYEERVLPRLVHSTCGAPVLSPWRRRVCSGLAGRVVELGFGSGANSRHYPPAVERVDAVEPNDLAWRLAERDLVPAAAPAGAVRVPNGGRALIVRSGLDGQRLPYDDGVFDHALVTFSLCTIPDAVGALQEARRVLADGGMLHFLEHGLAPEASVRRWQRRFEPVQRRLAGGCHLTREPPALLDAAGFRILELERTYLPGIPRFEGALYLGTARASGASGPEE